MDESLTLGAKKMIYEVCCDGKNLTTVLVMANCESEAIEKARQYLKPLKGFFSADQLLEEELEDIDLTEVIS